MSTSKSRSSPARWSPRRVAVAGPVVLALIFLAGATAHAEAGNWGAHVAYTKAKDAPDGNYLVGGHVELMLMPVLGVQGALDYRSDDKYMAQSGKAGVRVRSIPVTLTGRLYLPGPLAIRPFAEGGAGWYHVVYDYTSSLEALGLDDDTVETFGWHVGVGTNLYLAPDVFLTGNARYVFVDPERKLDSAAREQIRDLDYDSYTLGLGLSVGF